MVEKAPEISKNEVNSIRLMPIFSIYVERVISSFTNSWYNKFMMWFSKQRNRALSIGVVRDEYIYTFKCTRFNFILLNCWFFRCIRIRILTYINLYSCRFRFSFFYFILFNHKICCERQKTKTERQLLS